MRRDSFFAGNDRGAASQGHIGGVEACLDALLADVTMLATAIVEYISA